MEKIDEVGSVYTQIGGKEIIDKLVDIFYEKVLQDETLSPIFQSFHSRFKNGFEEGKRKQKLFLAQRFGGPRDYEKERGHPRLRMRHAPFKIGMKERNAWIKLMLESLDEVGIGSEHKARKKIEAYFSTTASHLINTQISFM